MNNKIKCTVCGKEVGMSASRRRRLEEKFGPGFRDEYKCRTCRPKASELKTAETEPEDSVDCSEAAE